MILLFIFEGLRDPSGISRWWIARIYRDSPMALCACATSKKEAGFIDRASRLSHLYTAPASSEYIVRTRADYPPLLSLPFVRLLSAVTSPS